jgi:hypothetical protein
MRPLIRKTTVTAGEMAISSDPRMQGAKPTLAILTRPSWSARPPVATTKTPVNKGVMLTAMLVRLSLICSSASIVGTIFSAVCAKARR